MICPHSILLSKNPKSAPRKSGSYPSKGAWYLLDATQIADAMEKHLEHEPAKESKSRIRRLRGMSNPDYRLRVGDYRVFYNDDEDARRVVVLRVMHKDQTQSYYEELKS